MESLKAALLGAVQGVTEFFPISSSAHLLALKEILGLEQGLAFDVAVHLATLLAVLVYFRRYLWQIATSGERGAVVLRLVAGTLPVVVIGLFVSSFRDSMSVWVVVAGWSFSAIYLMLTRGRTGTRNFKDLSYPRVVAIGTVQALALFPGVSRAGSTIAAGLFLGLERDAAARFSFLLAIPAICGAGLLEALKLWDEPAAHSGLLPAVSVAMPIAFAVGMLAIHWLLRVVRADTFHRFGWYNLTAAILFAIYLTQRGG